MDGTLCDLAWPVARLGDALKELICRTDQAASSNGLPQAPKHGEQISEWIQDFARRAGCEAEPLATTLGELPNELAAAYPALIQLGEDAYLVVLSAKGKHLHVLTPVLTRKQVAIEDLCGILRKPAEASHRSSLEEMLSGSGISSGRSAKAMALLLNDQLSRTRFNACWVLRSEPGANPMRLLRQAGVIGNATGMVAAHTVQYVLWLASWAILASLSNTGRMDRGWLLGWALLLLTLVPCQVITTWLQGLFAIGLGGFLKRRLLCGAMKLLPEEMRHGGIGSFLGQALEAEAVETLALSGGIAGLLATVEIVLAMFVLGRFALVLAFWSLLTALAAWRFLRAFARWTDTRMAMTEDLVEAMVGHRTRVAQLQRSEWHEGEDQALHGYLAMSKSLDNTGAWLIAAIPRGWLLAGLFCLLPAIAARHGAGTGIGLTLGGVLLAYTALRKLTGSFADLAAAWVAFKRTEPLFQAAARQEKLGESLVAKSHRSRKVIEADRLSYRYRASGKAALQAGSLTVQHGDRILLGGPSGGGKTTFASLLSGMREPESGLLLSNGLDRATLGSSEWRKRIAAAPQFHENYILTETLAFNLMLGKRWPPTQADMEEAETVCRELGLGDLLDSMPSGLMQMVGEGGWQLSHGERSRVFIARALLQSADLVILDESFAALDPENTKIALEATIERAKTLMVIAHP